MSGGAGTPCGRLHRVGWLSSRDYALSNAVAVGSPPLPPSPLPQAETVAAGQLLEQQFAAAAEATAAAAVVSEQRLQAAAEGAAAAATASEQRLQAERERSQQLVLASMEECQRLTK